MEATEAAAKFAMLFMKQMLTREEAKKEVLTAKRLAIAR